MATRSRRVAAGRRTAMRQVVTVAELRAARAVFGRRGESVAFVPTMGAIHEGHLSLVALARRAADRVVASIFVNPLQFGPGEDYRRYPRPLRRDRARFAAAGVDLLWEPRVEDVYPPGDRTRVQVRELTATLEGASRPGHFDGVTTVVARLLHAVQPEQLWLGQKDAQQAVVLERMIADLLVPTRVRRGPTIREPDGLARSSRNAYLGARERQQAVALSQGLSSARVLLGRGERSAARLAAAIRLEWSGYPLVREDYVAVVDAGTLQPVRTVNGRVLVAVAARIGRTRLIDNFEWSPR